MPRSKPVNKQYETVELNAVDNSPGPRALCYSASVQVELPGGTLLECLNNKHAAALAASINAMVTQVHTPIASKPRK